MPCAIICKTIITRQGLIYNMNVYTADIDNFTIGLLKECVSGKQYEISTRFRSEDDRKRSLLAHALLNRAVSETYPGVPLPVETVTDGFGKPHLFLPAGKDDPENSPKGDGNTETREIYFSLSHSGNLAMCAVDTNITGCDIELIKEKKHGHERIAARCFSAKELDLAGDTEGFYRIWTLKESFLKAIGLGLRFPLDRFSISDYDSQNGHCNFLVNDPDNVPSQLTPFVNTDSGVLSLTGTSMMIDGGYAVAFTRLCSDEKITFHTISDPVNLLPDQYQRSPQISSHKSVQ